MEHRAEIRDFLTTRRGKVTPQQAGLPAYGTNRRVPGLRREEVAMLAGVSVDYYTRLERGNLAGVSDSVLDALARALQLDEAERVHLFDLARAASTSGAAVRRRRQPTQHVRPPVQQVLDAMTMAPAYVRNGRLDVLAANELGRAVFAPLFETAAGPPNIARFIFLDAAAQRFYVEWEQLAADTVAILRAEAGRDPFDRAMSDLVGELSTRSERLPHLVGGAQRAAAPHRRQAPAPPGGRRPDARLRVDGADRRPGAAAQRLQRRAGLTGRGCAAAAGQLDGTDARMTENAGLVP